MLPLARQVENYLAFELLTAGWVAWNLPPSSTALGHGGGRDEVHVEGLEHKLSGRSDHEFGIGAWEKSPVTYPTTASPTANRPLCGPTAYAYAHRARSDLGVWPLADLEQFGAPVFV